MPKPEVMRAPSTGVFISMPLSALAVGVEIVGRLVGIGLIAVERDLAARPVCIIA